MQTLYYTKTHLEALQASFLSETNVYLGCTCLYFLWPSWIWHRDESSNIILTQHQKRTGRPKISWIRGIALVSVLHWSKSKNSTNPRCYLGGHLGFGLKMTPKHNFNTRNGFVALKLVGLEVLLMSLCYIGQNLGIPQIQDGHRTPYWITKKPMQRMIENHRFWTLGTLKQLSWKKSAF